MIGPSELNRPGHATKVLLRLLFRIPLFLIFLLAFSCFAYAKSQCSASLRSEWTRTDTNFMIQSLIEDLENSGLSSDSLVKELSDLKFKNREIKDLNPARLIELKNYEELAGRLQQKLFDKEKRKTVAKSELYFKQWLERQILTKGLKVFAMNHVGEFKLSRLQRIQIFVDRAFRSGLMKIVMLATLNLPDTKDQALPNKLLEQILLNGWTPFQKQLESLYPPQKVNHIYRVVQRGMAILTIPLALSLAISDFPETEMKIRETQASVVVEEIAETGNKYDLMKSELTKENEELRKLLDRRRLKHGKNQQ